MVLYSTGYIVRKAVGLWNDLALDGVEVVLSEGKTFCSIIYVVGA